MLLPSSTSTLSEARGRHSGAIIAIALSPSFQHLVRHHAALPREGRQTGLRQVSYQPLLCSHRPLGLLGQFKPDGLPGLLLPHRRPIDRIPARCNILDLEGNDIAATQLAVDGQIEHRRDKHDLYTAEAIASRWSLRREREGFDWLQLGAKPTRPTQQLWFVHPVHGITARWSVHVDEPGKPVAECVSVFQREAA